MSTTEIMRVSYTPDGDTVRCLRPLAANGITRTEEVRFRLAYLDAPELTNPAMYADAVSARAYSAAVAGPPRAGQSHTLRPGCLWPADRRNPAGAG